MKNNTVLSLIGNTPLVKVMNIDTGSCDLYLKLESQNPGGSIKDRIALSMIEAAEREGKIKPGDTLIEATAGNTGLGLALVASQKGYNLVLIIPDKMSQEKIFHLKALGADVIMTRSDVGKGHPEYYQDMAERIAKDNHWFYVNQFENPHNPKTHEKYTGPEIWKQLEHKVDAIVCGVGSGGTLTGLGRFFDSVSPRTEIVLADPKGSILAPYVQTGAMIQAGSWLVEGIGEDFIPANCDLSYVWQAYTISDSESISTAREVLRQEGVICGSSSGTLIAAALKYCREQTEKKRVVTFVCDSGNKYLSKIYNQYWLDDHGFISGSQNNDLRDLIVRPHSARGAITIQPHELLRDAYRKMKMYDVSQLPVIEDEQLVGLISEIDILLAVTGNTSGFFITVRDAMTKSLVKIDVNQQIDSLLPIFEKGMVAIIMDRDQFLGLITPIDLLQYLRKRIGHI